MLRFPRFSKSVFAASGFLLAASFPAQAEHFSVLYSFTGGADGGGPVAGLAIDLQGNLYGTTIQGGVTSACRNKGCGTVFKVASDGSESVLYAFAGGADGAEPQSILNHRADGSIYGTTYAGGRQCRGRGCGTIFRIAPDGTKSTLFSFRKHEDGGNPYGGPLVDGAGNIFGTTLWGGPKRFGVVYKLASNGTYSVLHAFDNGAVDGGFLQAGLIKDGTGNLYGTATAGGASFSGTVFKIAPDDTFSVLHAFNGGSDGFGPAAPLTRDHAGNLYGTTFKGGSGGFNGTVFKIATNGTESILYTFTGGNDGQFPNSAPLPDGAGNLYGTTLEGGDFGLGTVYKLAPDGTKTVLHAFSGGSDGALPFGGVVADHQGRLYGTTWQAGLNTTGCGNVGCGTVYKIKE